MFRQENLIDNQILVMRLLMINIEKHRKTHQAFIVKLVFKIIRILITQYQDLLD